MASKTENQFNGCLLPVKPTMWFLLCARKDVRAQSSTDDQKQSAMIVRFVSLPIPSPRTTTSRFVPSTHLTDLPPRYIIERGGENGDLDAN